MKSTLYPPFSSNSSSSSSPPLTDQTSTPKTNYQIPCAACKILRRRCASECILAPYFPPTDPLKFTTAHHVFGASNIIKSLQELPESQRADAVSSMVYEAAVRMKDPVYGCAGAVCYLQKQVEELQTQLARTRAQLLAAETHRSQLLSLFYKDMDFSSFPPHLPITHSPSSPLNPFQPLDDFLLLDDTYGTILEETFWTSS